jgi:hypothetical protein
VIAFADTDVLIELAALDLLNEFLVVFELKHVDVYVLPREMKRLASADIIADYGQDASVRAVAFANRAGKISDHNREDHLLLTSIADVDPGEAVLYLAATTMSVDLVVSGDGRALRALWSSQAARRICARLSGKFICLEQLLLALIDHQGFVAIRGKVVKARTTNIAINTMFRAGGQGTEAAVVAALKSRVTDLRAATGSHLSEYHGV